MKIIEKIDTMRRLRRRLVEPVGFVPTMGYLHEGHLSLVRVAREENTSVVVSIFVNPTQFGPQEDLTSYPRNTKRDLELLAKETVDVVFIPEASEMYPGSYSTWVEVDRLTQRLEGASRPSHFKGVTTVVAKLFNIIQPTQAYFGQKDAQQIAVIKRMVADLNMNLKIVTAPTVREPDGLAMSSRNSYLNPQERQAAVVLYQALCLAQQLWSQGEKNAPRICQEMINLIQKQPLASIDYISVADAETLNELDTISSPALVSLAVGIGKTRLIDNIVLQ
ncbi:MAG: pantoate--beta-alanine ligase [Dehalococcoidales bacterium]|nr:pantoate--beta-alanine ligase [Dehalococcoidales bacterium]